MVTRENDGGWRPADPEGAGNQDRADGEPEARHDADGQRAEANNAVLLDDLEIVLRELATDFQSTDESAAVPPEDATADAQSLPQETGDKLRLPSAMEFNLASPTDYEPDRQPYDDHRTSQAGHEERIPAQSSMARILAARHDTGEPRAEPHDAAENAHGRAEAQLSSSSRDGNRLEPELSDPPVLRRVVARSGHGAALGTGLAVLLIAGTTAAFGFIEPLKGLLPERVAAVFDLVSRGNLKSADHSARNGNAQNSDVQNTETVTSAGGIETAGVEANGIDMPSITGMPADQSDHSDDGQASPIAPISQPEIAPVDPPTTASAAEFAETTDAKAIGADTLNSDKSPDLIAQDSAVQASLKDPEKRPQEPAQNEAWVEARTVTDAEQVTTDAIEHPNGGERGAGAVTGQASVATSDVVNQALEPTVGPIEIAGITPDMAVGNEINSNELAATIMNLSPPVPDVSQPEISRRSETVLTRQNSSFPSPGADTDSLLARGQELLQRGNIATARLLFHRVVAMGDSRGAKAMGMTYDPKIHQRLPIAGLKPDDEQAEIWYRKAREMAEDKRTRDAAIEDDVSDLKN